MNWLRIFATFLIFIVIIGSSAVIYQLFFEDIPKKNIIDHKAKIREMVTTYSTDLKPSLSEVEQSRQNGIKPYQIEAQVQKIDRKKQKQKNKLTTALTLKDIRKTLNNNRSEVKNIHHLKAKKNIYGTQYKETFEILKILLVEASQNHIPMQNIVLNSSISSILYSQDQRDKFFQLISQKFQIPIEVVEELSYNNGYLWDWIRELNNR